MLNTTSDQNSFEQLLEIVDLNKKNSFPDVFEPNKVLLENLNCFQIKKILSKSIGWVDPNKTQLSKEMDEYNHWIELLTYKMVQNSPSFKLINEDQCLKESDFNPDKLREIKTKFNIGQEQSLDKNDLMRLYYTHKFLGQERDFVSAIKPEKQKENSLINYKLDIESDELQHIHALRSITKETQSQILRRRFDAIEGGRFHTCTSLYNQGINNKINERSHGIVVDSHPVSAGHYTADYWSEDYDYPQEFEGKDVKKLREFASDRHFIFYYCHVIKNPNAHQHHFEKYGKCATFCQSLVDKSLLPSTLTTNVESYLDPRMTYEKAVSNHLFGDTEFGFYHHVEDSKKMPSVGNSIFSITESDGFAKIKLSTEDKRYTESNIYLNLSDIKGLTNGTESLDDFIDLFCETAFQRKKALEDPSFSNEMKKIEWQRTVFCNDVKTDLEKKLAILEKDLKSFQSNPENTAILRKYSSKLTGNDFWTPCCGPNNEIYDQDHRLLSIEERTGLINPENINFVLQSEIYKTKSEIDYLSQLSAMPSADQVKAKLSRNLELYSKYGSKTSLTDILDSMIGIPNFKKSFATDDAGAIDNNSEKKFQILVERLAVEGFFDVDNISDVEVKKQREATKVELMQIATKFTLNLDEVILEAQNMALTTQQSIEPLDTTPPPPQPFKYVPLERILPTQITMSDEQGSADEKPKIGGIDYQLSKKEIQELLSPYRLQYSPKYEKNYFGNWVEISQPKTPGHQLYFNETFKLDFDSEIDLRSSINHTFTNLSSNIIEYNSACEREKAKDDKGRDIHDGYHALTTSYYAKELLKFYQTNKALFSEEMQQQIAEFDDPQKIKDLEILSIMHDSARYHGSHDQDEHKNAFYVALKLRNMGDSRFQGKEISEEGLKMVMDLANKENEGEKSLMSKLIQSADSLAILRCKEMKNGQEYNFYFNNLYEDLTKITDEKVREREKARLMVIGSLLLENEQAYKPPQFLEFSPKPFDDFVEYKKTQELSKAFEYQITHDQDGFNKLLKAGCFKYILQNFSRDEIDKNFSNSKSYSEYFRSFVFGFEKFDDFVIRNSITKINANDLADLIDLGIDIYSSSNHGKAPLAYQIAKEDWKASKLDKKLLEYGALIGTSNFVFQNPTTEEKNMLEFCQKLKEGNAEILQQISQGLGQDAFTSKTDLHEKVQTLTFKNNQNEEVSISLNGFGLIRILEQNLIQTPFLDVKTSLASLKTLRDSEVKQPIAQGNLVIQLGSR